MRLICPHCATPLSLDALTEDASARALLAQLARLGSAAAPLTAYLGLFKPRQQSLRWSRALALAQQVIEHGEPAGLDTLASALVETVEAMREKRQAANWRPLTTHNYLWRVLENRQAQGVSAPALSSGTPTGSGAPRSRTAQVCEQLRALHAPQDVPAWFATAIYHGLATLVMASLDGTPAYDVLPELAQQWAAELWPRRAWREDCRFRGRARIDQTWRTLVEARRWPTQGDFLALIPSV